MIILQKIKARPLTIVALVLILFIGAFSVIRGSTYEVLEGEKLLESEQNAKVYGRIKKIEYKNQQTILTLSDSYLEINSKEYYFNKILAKTPGNQFFKIGSEITGNAEVSPFSKATNPGQFDEYEYYKSLGINTRVQLLEYDVNPEKFSDVETNLAMFRNKLSNSIDNSFLSDGEKGILNAMILGEKSELSKEAKDLYKTAGILHIISISGLHISIVGMGVFQFLRKRGICYLYSTCLSSIVVACFVVMTGGSVSSMRALIMFLISMGAELLGRSTDLISSISLAAILLLINNPSIIGNPGFLLSFGAVCGIAFWGDSIKLFDNKKNYLLAKLGNGLLSGIGLILFTIPIVLYNYFEIPLYSFLSNLIVIPLAPVILVGGILASFAGVFFTPLSNGIFIFPKIILVINEMLAKGINRLPFSTVILGKPRIVNIAAYYIALIILRIIVGKLKHNIILPKDDNGEKKTGMLYLRKIITCACVTFLMFVSISYQPRYKDRITFLDVGQGECILIRCKNGSNILIDAGSSTVSNVGEQRIIHCLKSLGVASIDKLILTHEDGDHTSGVDELIHSNIKIKSIVLSKLQLERGLFSELDETGMIEEVIAGDMIYEGDTCFRILAPGKDLNFSDNAASVVVEMENKEKTVLFTGDLEGEGEEALISSGLLHSVDILKVAHHGSKNSSSDEFLEVTSPKLAVISAGKRNSYGHPHKETLERLKEIGCEIVVTKDVGAITISV